MSSRDDGGQAESRKTVGKRAAPVWLAAYPRRVTIQTPPSPLLSLPSTSDTCLILDSSGGLAGAPGGGLVQKSQPRVLQECGKGKGGARQGEAGLAGDCARRILLLR